MTFHGNHLIEAELAWSPGGCPSLRGPRRGISEAVRQCAVIPTTGSLSGVAPIEP